MSDTPPPGANKDVQEPANLKFLRRLVTLLTGTMIFGVLGIFVLLVLRLQQPSIEIPESLDLPDGVAVQAYTQAPGFIAVVTDSNQILFFDPETGTLRQTIEIE